MIEGGAPAAPPAGPAPMPPAGGAPGAPKTGSVATPATLIVSLPADAKLSIDENLTTSTSASRTFVTPALKVGTSYVYTLKAELNGEIVSKTVTVKAGEETRVAIEIPVATAAR